ncbi:hypothetical protein H2248_010326 [Termitomyces sp. 'cryptogamus']|nr:hypothetical protein H2248_010326 [Termitomyces sp. 'cryptogamus']
MAPSLAQATMYMKIASIASKITCDKNYPDALPQVQFLSRVNLPFVSQTNGKGRSAQSSRVIFVVPQ